MWFVLDNSLVLPEYLVEFEYVTNLKGLNDTPSTIKKSNATHHDLSQSSDILNDECNKMFEAINGSQ